MVRSGNAIASRASVTPRQVGRTACMRASASRSARPRSAFAPLSLCMETTVTAGTSYRHQARALIDLRRGRLVGAEIRLGDAGIAQERPARALCGDAAIG